MKIKGKTILVTGAARGIGRSLCGEFAKKGAGIIYMWDVDTKTLSEASRDLQAQYSDVKIQPVSVDITSHDAISRAEPAVETAVDILVNNAGLFYANDILEFPEDRIRRIFDVNIISQYFIVQKYLPGMLTRGQGQLVTMASAGAVIGANLLSGYSATKFACRGFHESVRLELYHLKGGEHIESTIIFPYYVNTRMSIGVKSLFPIMEADAITPKMVKAIEKGQAELFLPGLFRWTNLVVRFLPPRLMDRILAWLGFSKSLENHIDRRPPEEATKSA